MAVSVTISSSFTDDESDYYPGSKERRVYLHPCARCGDGLVTTADGHCSECQAVEQGSYQYLYVIGDRDGPVKIGRAIDPKVRLGALQIGNPWPLTLLYAKPKAGHLEPLLHSHFAANRIGGEWFDFGDHETALAEIRREVARLTRKCR